MTLDNILEEIKKAEKIAILTHELPDGDAVGSSLAMMFALKSIGKNPDVIIPEFSSCFSFLPGISELKKETNVEKYDLAIALDCADAKILCGNKEFFEKAKNKIVIDHHGSNKMYGDINFVNPVSPACCEVLIGMFDYFGIEITKDIGTCLITGIITDTGGFDYNVNPETFDFAAMLLRKGIKISDVYSKTLKTKTRANFELRRKAIDRMEFLEDGKVTFTYITNKDLKEVNAGIGDHEGLVEIGRDVEGVEVSVFIRQKDEEETYKVSMRSNDYVNVSDVCMMFGGGGHEKAAGAVIQGDIEQVKQKIMKELKKVLK